MGNLLHPPQSNLWRRSVPSAENQSAATWETCVLLAQKTLGLNFNCQVLAVINVVTRRGNIGMGDPKQLEIMSLMMGDMDRPV
jgi:hypothetical protein